MDLAPELLEGDCLAIMAGLEAASFDAIVTDPPYGLAFMGVHWDHGVPGVDFWREALRVLKPGGHLVAFGGTRTEHRLICAVEDAGFEIRDKLMWLYGSGFPKSTDVSKQIDKGFRKDETGEGYAWRPSSAPDAGVYAITGFVRNARNAAGKTNAEIDALFGFHGMAGHWTSLASQPAVPTWPQWEKLKGLLGFSDEMDAAVIAINGGKGDRSLEGTAFAARPVIGTDMGKDAINAHMFAPGTGNYLPKEYPVTEPATEAAKLWNGWGTTLKPAWEPIMLARRPLEGTVAQNVLRYGVGALNVEAARLPAGEDYTELEVTQGLGGQPTSYSPRTASREFTPGSGRWPPNVAVGHLPECELIGVREIGVTRAPDQRNYPRERGVMHKLDDMTVARPMGFRAYADEDGLEKMPAYKCAPGCPVAMIDAQSGYSESRRAVLTSTPGIIYGGGNGLPSHTGTYGQDDAGGASRFFYCAKASRAEREEGLLGLPLRLFVQSEGGQDALENGAAEYQGAGGVGFNVVKRVRNHHPTVKPVALMRWLVRLLVRPGARILDPFGGSGTTGIAAYAEEVKAILIEKEADFCAIARRRMAHHSRQPSLWETPA